MSQVEYEHQMKAEREKAKQEAIRAAQVEAAAKRAQEVLDEPPSGTVKCIAETMENFAKRTRMDPDFSDEHRHPPRAPMRDFNYEGKLLQPINFHGNDIEGVHHTLMVCPEMRDKIIKAEFIPLEKLGSDDLLQQAMHQAEMTDQGYASQNVPAKVPKTPVKSKFEIFRHLFLFGSYYL